MAPAAQPPWAMTTAMCRWSAVTAAATSGSTAHPPCPPTTSATHPSWLSPAHRLPQTHTGTSPLSLLSLSQRGRLLSSRPLRSQRCSRLPTLQPAPAQSRIQAGRAPSSSVAVPHSQRSQLTAMQLTASRPPQQPPPSSAGSVPPRQLALPTQQLRRSSSLQARPLQKLAGPAPSHSSQLHNSSPTRHTRRSQSRQHLQQLQQQQQLSPTWAQHMQPSMPSPPRALLPNPRSALQKCLRVPIGPHAVQRPSQPAAAPARPHQQHLLAPHYSACIRRRLQEPGFPRRPPPHSHSSSQTCSCTHSSKGHSHGLGRDSITQPGSQTWTL
jgi:hypothetical protein